MDSPLSNPDFLRTSNLTSNLQFLDENSTARYEPTEEEIYNYAEWLGMSLPEDERFLYLAKQGLSESLPPEWKACEGKNGEIYYFNTETKEKSEEHPSDKRIFELFLKEKVAYEVSKVTEGKCEEAIRSPEAQTLKELIEKRNALKEEHQKLKEKQEKQKSEALEKELESMKKMIYQEEETKYLRKLEELKAAALTSIENEKAEESSRMKHKQEELRRQLDAEYDELPDLNDYEASLVNDYNKRVADLEAEHQEKKNSLIEQFKYEQNAKMEQMAQDYIRKKEKKLKKLEEKYEQEKKEAEKRRKEAEKEKSQRAESLKKDIEALTKLYEEKIAQKNSIKQAKIDQLMELEKILGSMNSTPEAKKIEELNQKGVSLEMALKSEEEMLERLTQEHEELLAQEETASRSLESARREYHLSLERVLVKLVSVIQNKEAAERTAGIPALLATLGKKLGGTGTFDATLNRTTGLISTIDQSLRNYQTLDNSTLHGGNYTQTQPSANGAYGNHNTSSFLQTMGNANHIMSQGSSVTETYKSRTQSLSRDPLKQMNGEAQQLLGASSGQYSRQKGQGQKFKS